MKLLCAIAYRDCSVSVCVCGGGGCTRDFLTEKYNDDFDETNSLAFSDVKVAKGRSTCAIQ